MTDTIWHTNTERPRKGAEILCIGHNDDGDFVIYGTASHYEDTFCIVGEIEVDYAPSSRAPKPITWAPAPQKRARNPIL